jgi:WhiB family redox-sensing transcriptional regulator
MSPRPEALTTVDMPRIPFAPTRTDWFDDAACRDADTDVFFPTSDADAGAAKAICAVCPVREECREFALETRPSDGVWGGLTPIERHRLIRRRQKAARTARTAA